MKANVNTKLTKSRGLSVYIRALSIEKQKRINSIISTTSAGEERWLVLKSYFMSISPKLVDNLFAWNVYRLSV